MARMNALLKWSKAHTRWALGIAVLLGAMAWSWLTDVIDGGRVLVDVIRVDLDDAADFMLGLAAMITAGAAWRKAKSNGYVEHKHHDQLEERVKLLEEGRPFDGTEGAEQ